VGPLSRAVLSRARYSRERNCAGMVPNQKSYAAAAAERNGGTVVSMRLSKLSPTQHIRDTTLSGNWMRCMILRDWIEQLNKHVSLRETKPNRNGWQTFTSLYVHDTFVRQAHGIECAPSNTRAEFRDYSRVRIDSPSQANIYTSSTDIKNKNKPKNKKSAKNIWQDK